MKRACLFSLILSLLFPIIAVSADASDSKDRTGVGIKIRNFKLKDQRGREINLAKYCQGRVTVVAFLGTECPLAQLYGPRLVQLAEHFQSKPVAFLAIDSNHQDVKSDVLAYVKTTGITFPILRDFKNMVADHFGATRTPEVFLLDKDLIVRYRGRIDDQFGIKDGISFKRVKAERHDLAEALTELLEGKPVSVPATEPIGCLIGRAPKPRANAAVTYASHVAAVFNRHCVECHRTGEVAPFSMAKYEDFEGWGDMIREVVADDRMPPWHANPEHGDFSNDSRLTEEEKELILQWVDEGCAPGDLTKTPPPPKFAKGWQLNGRKQVFFMRASKEPFIVPAEGKVDYQYFTVDPGFTEDKWVQAAEARAGDRSVVHHIIVFVEPPLAPGTHRLPFSFDGFLVATAPGARPMVLPPGYAKKIPAGSKLKFQMHYTPNGKKTSDLSSVGLIYANPDTVTTVVRTEFAADLLFKIPPNADNHAVNSMKTFRHDTQLLSLYPHMHVRGKAFRYVAHYPDGTNEVLLDIPRYDFNWQNTYELTEPKLLPKGTEIRCEARFDNSKSNPSNPDPGATVRFGEQTWEEMMIGFMDVAFPRDQEKANRIAAQGSNPKGTTAPRKLRAGVRVPVRSASAQR